MRIAVFAHEFPTPSETFVLDHVIGLIERGHDVTVFAHRPRAAIAMDPAADRHRLHARTFYPDIPEGRARRIFGACAVVATLLPSRANLLARSLDAARYGRDALSLRLLYWTKLLERHAPFDVLHCHFGPVGNLIANLREIGAIRGPLVTTFHGVDMSAALERSPMPYRDLFARGELFLAVSDHWRERLAKLGCDRARLFTQRMGVDLGRHRLRAVGGEGCRHAADESKCPDGPASGAWSALLLQARGLRRSVR